MNEIKILDEIDKIETKKNRSMLSAIIIVLIIVVAGFFGTRYFLSTLVDNSKKIGETIKCKNFEITVNNVDFKKRGTTLDRYTSISDPEWIGLTLTVKNIGRLEEKFNEKILSVTNHKGKTLKRPVFEYAIWGIEALDNPTLEVNDSKKGYVTFINTDENHNKLRLKITCDKEIIEYNISK